MAYFLGSDSELPALTTSEVLKQIQPGFYVSRAAESDSPPKQLACPHIYYLGSHQGCGCGFRKSDSGVTDEFADDGAEAQSDHEALAGYLQSLPPQSRPRQIYGCWSGDEQTPAEYFRVCTPSELANPKFAFRERELITLEI